MSDSESPDSAVPELSPYRDLQFDGDRLVAVILEDGVAVPVRLVCLALGLDIGSQSERLQSHDVLATGLRIVRIRQGKQLRPVVALLHRYIPFWLATINPKDVKSEVRSKLVRYQTELVDVLAALYGNDLRAISSTSADPTLAALQQSMAQALTELRLTREAIVAFQQQQQAQDTQLADHGERISEQQRQLARVENVVDDVLEQLAQHTTITTAQQEIIARAIKRLAARYQQRTGQEIFGQLFGKFCQQFNTPRYALLSARRYQEALQWINDQARALLPDDPDAALPLQESML
jgi:P22_AR N-terminal domain